MADTKLVISLEQENVKLKEDNEMLLKIITQMKVTLNRLVDHSISKEDR